MKKIDVHLRNRQALVIATVYAAAELRFFDFDPLIHDVLRQEANHDIGIGIYSGNFRAKFKTCRAQLQIKEKSVLVSWEAFPLWWSDHPKWHEGPSCHTLESWPEAEPTVSCL